MTASTIKLTVDGKTIYVGTNDGVAGFDIEIDYSEYFSRIATAAETMATNSTTMANNLTTISNNIATIKDDIHRLRQLGDVGGSGIRTISPWFWLGYAFLWKLYIEEGRVVDDQWQVDEATRLASIQRMKDYMAQLHAAFPDGESYWTW